MSSQPEVVNYTGSRRKRFEGYKIELEYRILWQDYLMMFDVDNRDVKSSDGQCPSYQIVKDFSQAVAEWATISIDPSIGKITSVYDGFILVSTIEAANEIWDNLKDIFLLSKLRRE